MWWIAGAVWLLVVLTVVFQSVYRIGDWWLDRRSGRVTAAPTGPEPRTDAAVGR